MKIDDRLKTNFASSQLRAMVNLRYTFHFISQLHNQFMDRFGLTMPQFNILRILRGANDWMSVNTVKDRMVEKSPNTTRLMDKLIDKKLIIRERCEDDRRVVYVRITEEGLDLLKRIDQAIEDDEVFSVNLSEKEADALSETLDKLREKWER